MLQFKKNRILAFGSGAYENEDKFEVKIALRPPEESTWEGVYDEDGLVDLQIESLVFDTVK